MYFILINFTKMIFEMTMISNILLYLYTSVIIYKKKKKQLLFAYWFFGLLFFLQPIYQNFKNSSNKKIFSNVLTFAVAIFYTLFSCVFWPNKK